MLERLNIHDAARAALLSNERQRHIVLALVDQERTQSELADLLGMKLNLLHYHLRRLVLARLVSVSRSQPRAGRAIAYYRAVARSFFVPAEIATAIPDRALIEELRDALERSRVGTYSGILYAYDDGPRMRVIQDRRPAHPTAELWHRMTLNDADAAALIEELKSLFARFEGRDTASGHRFVAFAALAPL